LLVTFGIAASGVFAVLIAFLPAAPPAPGGPLDRADVTQLVAQADADSLAPFATRADKAYVFSPDRRAAIGYRVLFGTALVGGDPVGSVDSAGAAIKAYLDLCTQHGWRPAVLGASDHVAPLWRQLGMRGLHIGGEAVLPVDEFSLASRRMRNERQGVSRTRNAGVTVTIGQLTAELADRLHPVLDKWLGRDRERGFAMNLDAILEPRPDCLFVTAYAPGGEAVAFARFAVCADGSVYTLDVAPLLRKVPATMAATQPTHADVATDGMGRRGRRTGRVRHTAATLQFRSAVGAYAGADAGADGGADGGHPRQCTPPRRFDNGLGRTDPMGFPTGDSRSPA
jgi:lysylphosphatidylglycerol synthetase-like protein (DUF2156 family)